MTLTGHTGSSLINFPVPRQMNANAARIDTSQAAPLFNLRGNSSMGTLPAPAIRIAGRPDSKVPPLFANANVDPQFLVGSNTGAETSTFIASIDEKWREDPSVLGKDASAIDPGFLGAGMMNPVTAKPHTF